MNLFLRELRSGIFNYAEGEDDEKKKTTSKTFVYKIFPCVEFIEYGTKKMNSYEGTNCDCLKKQQ